MRCWCVCVLCMECKRVNDCEHFARHRRVSPKLQAFLCECIIITKVMSVADTCMLARIQCHKFNRFCRCPDSKASKPVSGKLSLKYIVSCVCVSAFEQIYLPLLLISTSTATAIAKPTTIMLQFQWCESAKLNQILVKEQL